MPLNVFEVQTNFLHIVDALQHTRNISTHDRGNVDVYLHGYKEKKTK